MNYMLRQMSKLYPPRLVMLCSILIRIENQIISIYNIFLYLYSATYTSIYLFVICLNLTVFLCFGILCKPIIDLRTYVCVCHALNSLTILHKM